MEPKNQLEHLNGPVNVPT